MKKLPNKKLHKIGYSVEVRDFDKIAALMDDEEIIVAATLIVESQAPLSQAIVNRVRASLEYSSIISAA